MPFNGTGTFVRLYNWTTDANNAIPISASRFDGEDNDFASGLSLCLTRDSQGAPTAPLTWAQPLTINVGSDETVIAAGRTGGVNNPQLQLKVADAVGATINLSTAQQLALAIGGTVYLALSGTGALSVNAPSGHAAIGIATGTYTIGNATDNPNTVFAGSGAVTLPSGGIANAGPLSIAGINVTGATVPANGIYLPSANTLGFSTNATACGSISSAGAWNIAAANAAISLTANGAANNYAASILGSSTSGQSYGLNIEAGSNTSDIALQITNQAISATYLRMYGDGEFLIGTPPAATEQTSSLWQVGYLDIPNNNVGTYTLALTDRGKFIDATGNVTIPANSSVPFPIGTTMLVYAGTGSSITIGITTDTLNWLPSIATGTRTLASHSIATLLKVGATTWFIWGFGIS
jgi:hypothetical protein